MAQIVLVHGIGQTQEGADTLEAAWLPALAAGVRKAGFGDLADQIWRGQPSADLEVRMAYYADLFTTPGSQGPADPLDDPEADAAEQLARQWLANACERADDPRDRADAARALDQWAAPSGPAQGARRALRPAMRSLSKLRWFAPLAVRAGGRALNEVPAYFSRDQVRSEAQARVLKLVDPGTRVVVGHSLGSVVAYEALHRADQDVTLVTLGSPLGLRTVIYDELQPAPPRVPGCVTQWHNFVDRDDLVAAVDDLEPLFPPAPGRDVIPRTNSSLDNGSQPHDAGPYLTKKSVGAAIANGCRGRVP
jgi:hypothetical protein